jgi:alanine racemase
MEEFDLRLWSGFIAAGGDSSVPAIIDQVAIDSRRIDSSHSLFVALPGTKVDGHNFVEKSGAKYVLVKKDWKGSGFHSNLIPLRVYDPLQAFQQIAKAYRQQMPAKVIAIAGSYGKTMVKDLLQAMVGSTKLVAASPESFNSQIGVALSLFKINKKHEIALIETAISKKFEMDRLADMITPDHIIITHIGKKHIATLGDLKTITSEFVKLGIRVPKNNWGIFPNTTLLHPFLPQLQATTHFWNETSLSLPHAIPDDTEHGSRMPYRIDFPDGTHFTSQASFGFYYFMDLLNITVKAAWLMGIPSEAIRTTLKNYTAEPMRTEIWRSPIGTTFINDTYCSDPQSVDRSMKHLEHIPANGRKIFIFGGMRGNQEHAKNDYRHIGQSIYRAQINRLYLVGPHDFDSLIGELAKKSAKTEIILCQTYQEAFELMRPWILQDDVVLIKGSKKEPLDIITEAFNDSISNNQCLINLAAIESNITTIRNKIAPDTRLMVIVKALAYGTNDVRMSQFLSTCGIDILGVSYVDEGVALKRAGIPQAIFVINAATYEAAKVVKWDLEVGVSNKEFIQALGKEAGRLKKSIKVHLHVDTGMSRFGCRPEEALEIAKYIRTFPYLDLDGIMTHFACADDPASDAFTLSQAQCFEQVIQTIRKTGISIKWTHAANSSGAIRFNFNQFNMVRIGLAAYGLYPSESAKEALDLRLAITLVSRIVGINTCRAGETISYGRTYTVQQEQQRIAVLPIGYFDGLHRNYSGKGAVIIRGQKAPMVGKICMDFMMVDISGIANAEIGDSVLIFGEDEHGNYQSPEELATSGDSIIHELITCLGPRIQRIFIHEEGSQFR